MMMINYLFIVMISTPSQFHRIVYYSRFNLRAFRLESRSSYVDFYTGMAVVGSLGKHRQTIECINYQEYHEQPKKAGVY